MPKAEALDRISEPDMQALLLDRDLWVQSRVDWHPPRVPF